ncbi:hypothetical protein [Hahella chejuensis]|uniref:hypothetical protein n=1 Tax=Hahella chejuensis TaxID=158327 RepID=UPI0003044684|nr:hypothetical protein [Hahella chejuensis]
MKKREVRLIKAFGRNEAGLADLPKKVSGTMVSRVVLGEESGCSRCFPHGFETVNARSPQRSWKTHRKTRWK